MAERRTPTSRSGLSRESRLLGYDARTGVLDLPPEPEPQPPEEVDLRDLRELVPAAEPGRQVDDWGRSERVFHAIEPLLDFYYRTGSAWRSRGSRTCRTRAARCSSRTTRARSRRTRR